MKSITQAIESIKKFDFKSASQKDIETVLPTFGMNNEYLHEIPKEFEQYIGWGIKFWQYPNQFSKFLFYLKEKKIDSYLEIGCRWGGTFIIVNEVLKRYNHSLVSHALDIIPPSEILDIYQNQFDGNKFFYHQIDSINPFLFQTLGDISTTLDLKIDLVFIDGCHSYTCVMKDYHTAIMLGAKYIVFHDIVNDSTKGNRLAWTEIKRNHQNIQEFTDQYDSLDGTFLGIGVIEVSKEDKIFPMYKTHYHHLFDW